MSIDDSFGRIISDIRDSAPKETKVSSDDIPLGTEKLIPWLRLRFPNEFPMGCNSFETLCILKGQENLLRFLEEKLQHIIMKGRLQNNNKGVDPYLNTR